MLENISKLKYNRAYEAIFNTSHTGRFPEGRPVRENICLKAFI
jgi:hypothetical protein